MPRLLQYTIAGIFHPVFVNLLSFWLLFKICPPLAFGIPVKMQQFMIFFVFASTGIIPVIMVVVLRITGRVKSFMLNSKEERNMPYLLTTLLYFFCFYNFYKLNVNGIILNYLLACTIILLMVTLINRFYKISIHMAGMGALTGLIAVMTYYNSADIRYLLIVVLILSGLVATARMFAGAHTFWQLILGYLGGFLVMFFAL
jgi:hypothetical protein